MIKEMSLNEMGGICGGTVTEMNELQQALAKSAFEGTVYEVCGHVPLANLGSARVVENCLDRLGITADISLGFAGTGIGSKPNTYFLREANRYITHQEALDHIAGERR